MVFCACAWLLLLVSVVGLHGTHTTFRERPQHSCGFDRYGSTTGSAQRLVETHLSPGVADWNIVVPVPPTCKNAQVTGAAMQVCDADAPPDVFMSDALSARVHRTGKLAGFATVNVTVHCILPPSPPRTLDTATFTTAAPLLHHTDTGFTNEMLSNEPISDEAVSSEVTSYESASKALTSNELITKVKPISSTAPPQTQEVTTAKVEPTSPTEEVTPPPKKTTHPKEKAPHSLKVTIKITPTPHKSTQKDQQKYNYVELPSLSNKKKFDEVMPLQSQEFSTLNIMTPPRISVMPPRKHDGHPRRPGAPSQHVAMPHHQHSGGPPRHPNGHHPPPLAGVLPPHSGLVQRPTPLYTASLADYETMPPLYDVIPSPYMVGPFLRPMDLLSSRLRLWQHRKPLLFFRQF